MNGDARIAYGNCEEIGCTGDGDRGRVEICPIAFFAAALTLRESQLSLAVAVRFEHQLPTLTLFMHEWPRVRQRRLPTCEEGWKDVT
jgi:hypothetical protein